ncbi:MAG: hypothetical protein ACQEP6_02755 [Patescibacteria group bacterium]
MNNESLISYSFSTAWSLFKTYWKLMLGAVLLVFVILTALGMMGSILFEEESGGLSLWGFGIFIMGSWLTLGIHRVFLELSSGTPTSVKRVFSQGVMAVLYLVVAGIFYGIIATLGFILLIIPGLFIAIKFYFYDILIADKQLGPIEALKRSWAMTAGHWFQLFGLLILVILLNFAGMLALGIGLLITVPVSAMVMICAYRYLSSESEKLSVEEEVDFGESKTEEVDEQVVEEQV